MLGSHMYTSTLRIENLSNTRDNGTMYSCIVNVLPSTISSFITGNENSNSLILNVAGIILDCTCTNSIINFEFTDFTADHVIVDIFFPSTPTAGDEFTMTCNISIPERLVHDLTRLSVVWSYNLAGTQKVEATNSDATIGNINKIGNLILSNLTLNPVKTSDGRRYYCLITFNDLRVNNVAFGDLSVQGKITTRQVENDYSASFYYSPST